MYILDKIIQSFFFVDILVKMNTAVQDVNGSLIEKRQHIIAKYAKKSLILDVLQIIPYELLGQAYPFLDM